MIRAAFRELLLAPMLEHRGRLALSIGAIALGVALGYSVQLVNGAAISEFTQAVHTLAGDADLHVRGGAAGAAGGFDEALYSRLARLPEVAVASPVVEVDAKVPGRREPLRVQGIDVFRAALIQPLAFGGEVGDRLDWLRPDRVFLSAAAADALGVARGDALAFQVGLGVRTFVVAGVLPADAIRGRLAMMDVAAAQAAFGRAGRLDRVDLRLRAGVPAEAFAARLRADMPPGVVVEPADADAERGASLSRSYRVNLNVLSLVALFTGGLLVFSTQALAVVRRRAQLALLRVLGVTRAGLVALLLAEAAAIGALGALAGLVLGQIAAEGVLRYFGAELGAGYFRGLRPAASFDAAAMAGFFLLGTATALLGSLASALEASRAQPAAALKAGDEQRAFAPLQPAWPGIALLALGAALTQAGPVRGLPIAGYVAIALLLVGTIALMPRIAVVFFRRLPGLRLPAAGLALAQLRGAPGPVGVSLAAIVAGVSLMVSMAIMIASFRQSLDDWLERVLPADLYVRAGLGGDSAFLSPADQRALAAVPGVRRAEFQRTQRLVLAPARPAIVLIARGVEREGRLPPLVGPAHERAAADPPPAWPSEIAADLYGWRPGQVIELPIPVADKAPKPRLGPHGLPAFVVAGVWRDYARQQGAVLIERDAYLALTRDASANEAALWLAPGASLDAVERALSGIPGGANLELARPGELRDVSLRIFDRTFAVTYALEAAAVIIGLLGLASSFGALVLARRREFGMLRHVGMTRGQIGAMLAFEGALVSSLGLAAGVALGWLVSLVLIHVVNRQSFHWSMDLHLPLRPLGAFVLAMLALATMTAMIAGRRAMSRDAVLAVKEDW
ncbi:MAG TPA: ABC transporter permease [Burkholderiales bacterium]|nr:ABC transporter permease [Burkholderiales bacterium]